MVLLVDQWSKRLVRRRVADRCLRAGPVLRIRPVAQRRGYYSRDVTRSLLPLVWLAALVCAIVLYGSGAKFGSPVALLGLSVALGGSAGNLWDILRRHYVVDFIDLRWWPVFNIADVAIIVGLVAALWPYG